MRHLILALTLVLALLGLSTSAQAQTAVCDSLSGGKRDVAQAVLNSQHPYDCWACSVFSICSVLF